jgi:hypothetical protein
MSALKWSLAVTAVILTCRKFFVWWNPYSSELMMNVAWLAELLATVAVIGSFVAMPLCWRGLSLHSGISSYFGAGIVVTTFIMLSFAPEHFIYTSEDLGAKSNDGILWFLTVLSHGFISVIPLGNLFNMLKHLPKDWPRFLNDYYCKVALISSSLIILYCLLARVDWVPSHELLYGLIKPLGGYDSVPSPLVSFLVTLALVPIILILTPETPRKEESLAACFS